MTMTDDPQVGAEQKPWIPNQASASTFGARIKAAREQLGMSQYDFAAVLGLRPNAVGNWERNQRQPPNMVDIARALQEHLGIDAIWLLGFRD